MIKLLLSLSVLCVVTTGKKDIELHENAFALADKQGPSVDDYDNARGCRSLAFSRKSKRIKKRS